MCVCLKQLPHEVESIKLQKHTHAETWCSRVGTEAARAALCMTNHTQGHTLLHLYSFCCSLFIFLIAALLTMSCGPQS